MTTTSKAKFIAQFGAVFEHSPWVVDEAWEQRPFADAEALHAACMAALQRAGATAQLALLNAHPELAGKAELTGASAAEQQGAGLQRLTEAEARRFAKLNATYRERFGFPFIICVRASSKAAILAAFEARLQNDAETERREAIAQIGLITKLRLQEMLEAAPT